MTAQDWINKAETAEHKAQSLRAAANGGGYGLTWAPWPAESIWLIEKAYWFRRYAIWLGR